MNNALTIDFAPLLPSIYLYSLCGAVGLFFVLSLLFHRNGIIPRTLCAAAFILLFINPSIIKERRESVPDVAVIIADRSPSQKFSNRMQRTDDILNELQRKISQIHGMEVRTVTSDEGPQQETRLFEGLDRILSDVPKGRRAGVIMITDGQVHDVPQDPQKSLDYGPLNVLITADKMERDRQLVILEAPSYGIVGQNVTLRFRIEDNNSGTDNFATVVIRQDNNDKPRTITVPVNQDQSLQISVDHAGQNIFDIETAEVDGEITAANNRTPLIVNGIRDRLRVLLVSGQPHAGGRTWRDMLTSDPGVDLVHFTILREPNKLDATPQNELSLIAFPFQELFEIKLYEFDLIIFDRYRLNRILPNYYFGNIARYVKEGGALLEASGADFASDNSIYTTDLKQILPAFPTGKVINRAFKPVITDLGHRHPVTENLSWPGGTDGNPGWGSWLRQVAVNPTSGEVLMNGADNMPLLILDRVGKGRVAQLASDQIWLWSRGHEGGGPQAEMLRRLAHWLMKEPELEENALNVSTDGSSLIIKRRSLTKEIVHITVKSPDGKTQKLDLKPVDSGTMETRIPTVSLGVYTIDDGSQKHFALVGSINPPELRNILGTEEKLMPVISATNGSINWLTDSPHPDINVLPAGRKYGGKGWVGLRANHSYNIADIRNIPLLPEWIYALFLLTMIIGCWWMEGRKKFKT